jgi:hypothetical protein
MVQTCLVNQDGAACVEANELDARGIELEDAIQQQESDIGLEATTRDGHALVNDEWEAITESKEDIAAKHKQIIEMHWQMNLVDAELHNQRNATIERSMIKKDFNTLALGSQHAEAQH